jgi:hypothetical protein
MTPDAKLRMDVYQEGQRAFNSGAVCPYTDWRAKTWAKGRAAAEAYSQQALPVDREVVRHTPGPWEISGPMGTEHLGGREPWFWVFAERTLHLQVKACSDGFVRGENEANARLIAAAPELLAALHECLTCEFAVTDKAAIARAEAAIAKALGPDTYFSNRTT